MTEPSAADTAPDRAPDETPDAVPAVVDGVDVDAVVASVRATAGVEDLDSGRLVRLATYLPGRTVGGVRVDDESLTVQVRVDGTVPLPELGAELQRRLRKLAGPRRVDVAISDITLGARTPR